MCIRHFTSDGILGTAFERKGLQAIFAEVEKVNIGTIIVKDMSRLGRSAAAVTYHTAPLHFPTDRVERKEAGKAKERTKEK